MAFQLSFMPYDPSVDELAQWVQNELERLANSMEESQEVVQLRPIGRVPDKFGDGALAEFLPGTLDLEGNPLPEGLCVYRAGTWNKLGEV
ncbi:hypothetical protein [Idiomarina abyssalis]|uniref:hypothetical protein n=1 Tax=Idiomarina abyssalis TaxID=86102 RepID=UPI003A8EA4FC